MSIFQNVAESFLKLKAYRRPQPGMTDLLVSVSKAMDLLEARPLRTGVRVAVIAGSIARIMGLSGREATSIIYAALLHDIGLAKIAADLYGYLPRHGTEKDLFSVHALLNARAVANPYEQSTYEQLHQILSLHPQMAANFIRQLHLSEDVVDIVAAHHELCDGSGYPLGLTAEQIPLGGKILAFADTVDSAMAEVTGLTPRQQALESFLEIKTVGKFDPDVVAAFRRIIDQNPDFLRRLAGLDVETMLRELVSERQVPLSGDMLLDIVRAMGELPDSLLPLYTKGQAEKTARVAVRIAEKLGIHREQCGELLLAALCLNLGKLALPIEVLLKQGTLSEGDWEKIYDYPHLTEEVLKGLPGFESIVLWASEHHERMNGRGYPSRKKGFEISVGGRILAIADVFVALTSARPYRNHPAHEPLDAIPILGQGRNTLYDNQLVSVLRQVILDTDVVAEQVY